MRKILLSLFSFIFICLLALAGSSQSAHEENGPCDRPYDLSVSNPWAIDGAWFYDRSHCKWQDVLERYHKAGGKIVLQFGSVLEKRSDDDLMTLTEWDDDNKPNPVRDCRHPDGTHCVDQAIKDLDTHGLKLANFLTWQMNKHYGPAVACPAPSLDRQILVPFDGGVKVFWRLVLPHDGQSACTYNGGKVDVLFLAYELTEDSEESDTGRLMVADALGMDVYLAAPMFPVQSDKQWAIDKNLIHSSLDWSRRLFNDYEQRHGHHPSFKGIYQTFESHIYINPDIEPDNEGKYTSFSEYGMELDIFKSISPERKYIISPYFGVRKNGLNASLDSTVEGFKQLARQGVDVIIPQDGRGTGKGALYWPFEENKEINEIDPLLANYEDVDGADTFVNQFNASTRELFDAMSTAGNELKTTEGIEVELWANLEAFEKDKDSPDFELCSYSRKNSRTTKQRLERAITMSTAKTTRIISYMYDPFYWCTDRFDTPSLMDQVEDDFDRPIINNAVYWDTDDGQGLVLRGYNIANADTTYKLTWYDSTWIIRSAIVERGWIDPDWGTKNGYSPGVQEVWIPFDHSDLAPDFYIHINGITRDGRSSYNQYSMKY
ncbi:MAG: hypothetical protein GY754_25090 [bacterium]|nr:hypothetical protein [bacterium]